MSAADLHSVARWDVAALRGAVAALDGVAARLPTCRSRLEALGHELEAGAVWSGPAATSAAGAVTALAGTAAAVATGVDDSLHGLDRFAREAAVAQELAERVVALAASADLPLGPSGVPLVPLPAPAPSMAADQAAVLVDRLHAGARAEAGAQEALQHAALARAAAEEALDALRGLGVAGGTVPATFADLAGAARTTGPLPVAAVPTGRSPAAVARWWAGLPPAARAGALAAEPRFLGDLDGLPAQVRDAANRRLLADALGDASSPGHDTAVVVAAQLAAEEWSGRTAQLYEFDPAAGLVAVSLGDLDAAAAVGVLVPGINTTPREDLGDALGKAGRVADAAEAAAPGLAVATVAWLGYRAPDTLRQAAGTGDARRGGAALDRALDGLAAGRESTGGGRARTTVLAHSYGTVVAHEAAHRPGRLAADAVVLLGSPGMGWDGAAGLEAPEVYDAWSPADPISWLGWFGQDPQLGSYGAVELPVDSGTVHTGYYDAGSDTLAALGRVVAGREPG